MTRSPFAPPPLWNRPCRMRGRVTYQLSEVQHADYVFNDTGQDGALEACLHIFKQEHWRHVPIEILQCLHVHSPCFKRCVSIGKLVHSWFYTRFDTTLMMQRRRPGGPSLPNEPLYGEGPARAVSRSSEPSFDGGPVSQGRYCSPPRQRRALLWRGLLWPEKVGGIKGHLDVVSKERHAMMHSRHGICSCGFERGCTSKAFILTRT